MFCYKVFEQGNEILLAVCDKDILNKTFEEGELSVTASEDFYSESECTEKEIVKLIKNATILNALGNNIIDLLIQQKLVNKENVIEIGSTKHAQVVSLSATIS